MSPLFHPNLNPPPQISKAYRHYYMEKWPAPQMMLFFISNSSLSSASRCQFSFSIARLDFSFRLRANKQEWKSIKKVVDDFTLQLHWKNVSSLRDANRMRAVFWEQQKKPSRCSPLCMGCMFPALDKHCRWFLLRIKHIMKQCVR